MAAGNWVRGQTLGRGSTATVSLATSTFSGEIFAVKSMDMSNSHSRLLQEERRILSSLNSPHIVSYKGFEITVEDGRVLHNLLMEYVSGGTIADEIKRRGGSLDELTVRRHTCGILKGLSYLHSLGIAHCDVKGRNVLLGSDGRPKIADLGCAKWVDSGGGGRLISGTPVFMSPEVARGEEQGLEADVWALGCTVVEMATGRPPWPDVSDPVSAIHRIGFSGDVPEFPIGISNDGRDFLSKCFKRDPRERWTVDQLLEHRFVDINSKLSFNWNSPKSTLDQDFWNSSEETEGEEERQDPAIAGDQSSSTPQERIRQLIAGNCVLSSSSSVSNWEFDENWITVRDGNLAGNSTSPENQYEDQISIRVDPPTTGSWLAGAGRSEELMVTAHYMVTEDACLSICEFYHHLIILQGDGSCDVLRVEEGKLFIGIINVIPTDINCLLLCSLMNLMIGTRSFHSNWLFLISPPSLYQINPLFWTCPLAKWAHLWERERIIRKVSNQPLVLDNI